MTAAALLVWASTIGWVVDRLVRVVRRRRARNAAAPAGEPPVLRVTIVRTSGLVCQHRGEKLINDALGRGWVICPWCGRAQRFEWSDQLQDAPQDAPPAPSGYDHPTP